MSSLHKMKEFFGLAPIEEYADEYEDDLRPERGRGYRDAHEDDYDDAYRGGGLYTETRRGRAIEHEDTLGGYRTRRGDIGTARRSVAVGGGYGSEYLPEERGQEEEARGVIATVRPTAYADASTIGEKFREGQPVIMDLVEMSNADAKRVVDFAAGLAFGLRGSFDKVATKVFLLSPEDVDVSADERRQLAERGGFYGQR